MESREDCNSINFLATATIALMPSSLTVTPFEASEMAFIASTKATLSVSKRCMELPSLPKNANRSPTPVPIEPRAIKPRTSISSLTPSNALPSISDAMEAAVLSLDMNIPISLPIWIKLSLIPSPIPPIKLPSILPKLPASRSSTGNPVLRKS